MSKTKTKRIWTILILVAIFAVAAIFYKQNYLDRDEPAKVVEDVTSKETIKAEEQPQKSVNNTSVATDEKDSATRTGAREYLSDYYNTKNGFNALGVSWEELNAKATDINFYIRVKSDGIESEWFKVDKVLEKTVSGVATYAAETPVLVEGDRYQYKVTFVSLKNQIRNIKINIINTAGATETNLFQKISRALFDNEADAAPAIISRSGWGAGAPNNTAAELQSYIEKNNINVKVGDIYWPAAHASKTTKFIIHHTAGQNNPTNPAAAVRAIWVYHSFSRGWGDIGYNYLVDQNGKIYEGRFGGDHVIAGHAAPYNYDEANEAASIGVSVLGDFSNYAPNQDILNSLGRIIGYKAYLYNINPLAIGKFEDKTTYNIAAHRDYTPTACPGAKLYAKLATVRSIANTEKGKYGHTIDSLSLNKTNLVLGETVTGSFTIKNTKNFAVTLERLKIEGLYADGTVDSFGGFNNIILQAAGSTGDFYTFNQSKALNKSGKANFYVLYKEGGLWVKPSALSGPNTVAVNVYDTPYNVQMTTALVIGPEFPMATAPIRGKFTLENIGEQPVTYDRIKIVTLNSSGGYATSSWAYSDVTVPGKSKYLFNQSVNLTADTYTLRVEYLKDGIWKSFVKGAGIVDTGTIKVFATPASLNLVSGITITKSSILVGENVGASFSLSNAGEQPIRLSSLRAVATTSTGAKNYFPETKDVVLCKTGLVDSRCSSYGSYSYTGEKSFASAGSYDVKIDALSGGLIQPIKVVGIAQAALTASTKLTVQAVNYNNIVLSVFKTNDSTPAIGQPTTVTYRLYNKNSYDLTFDRLKIDALYSNGKRADFVGLSNYKIPANSYLDRVERRVVDSSVAMTYKFAYQQGGVWRSPVLQRGVPRTIGVLPHSPNLKINYSLNINPGAALAGSTFSALFKIKNYESATVYINSLKAGAKVNGHTYYFPSVSLGIPPGTTKTYNQSLVIEEGVNHAAFITYKRYDGNWMKPPVSTTGIYNTDTFKVYIETATLEGRTLPASSGRVAREQHLNLVASETASHHYTASGVPLDPSWLRNGMAGGGGSFVSNGYAPVQDERYYITMRWNYVEWYEGTLGVADQMYCGSGYQYYSVNYYDSYKNGSGDYCVPKTYSRNADYDLKTWYWKKRVVVTNPVNGKKVVASIIESGPAIWTGRKAGLSPETMSALGVSTSTNANLPLNFAWAADQSTPLGPAN